MTRLHREIDDWRKHVKKACLDSYTLFERQVKEFLVMIDAPLAEIKAFVDGVEEQDKLNEIEAYFQKKHSAALGSLAHQV